MLRNQSANRAPGLLCVEGREEALEPWDTHRISWESAWRRAAGHVLAQYIVEQRLEPKGPHRS